VIRAHERALCIDSINSLFRDGADLDYISARGWKAFEAPGVEPVFPKKDQAIDYEQNCACFRSGEIRVLDSTGKVEHTIAFSEADRKL
jgi:hypothetical protein